MLCKSASKQEWCSIKLGCRTYYLVLYHNHWCMIHTMYREMFYSRVPGTVPGIYQVRCMSRDDESTSSGSPLCHWSFSPTVGPYMLNLPDGGCLTGWLLFLLLFSCSLHRLFWFHCCGFFNRMVAAPHRLWFVLFLLCHVAVGSHCTG